MQAHLLFGFPQFFRFIIIFCFGLISYPSLCLPFVHKSPHLIEEDVKAKANTSVCHTTNLSHTWEQNTETEKFSLRIFSLGRISRTFWSGSLGQGPNLMSIIS